MAMKYMISWFERPQGSPGEYENAQKRILEVFGQWKAPAGFTIELFVVRVGWAPVSGLRRSVGRAQVLLDVPGFRIPGATRDCRRRRRPGRTRSHRLARRAETQLTSEKITSDRPQCVREPACVPACVRRLARKLR